MYWLVRWRLEEGMVVSSSRSEPASLSRGDEGRTSSANSEEACEERGDPRGESSVSMVR